MDAKIMNKDDLTKAAAEAQSQSFRDPLALSDRSSETNSFFFSDSEYSTDQTEEEEEEENISGVKIVDLDAELFEVFEDENEIEDGEIRPEDFDYWTEADYISSRKFTRKMAAQINSCGYFKEIEDLTREAAEEGCELFNWDHVPLKELAHYASFLPVFKTRKNLAHARFLTKEELIHEAAEAGYKSIPESDIGLDVHAEEMVRRVNHFINRDDHVKALRGLSEIIEFLTQCGHIIGQEYANQQLQQTFQRRANVMFKNKENWRFVIEDLKFALHYSKNPLTEYAMLDRMARCLKYIGEESVAQEIADKAREAVTKNPKVQESMKERLLERIGKLELWKDDGKAGPIPKVAEDFCNHSKLSFEHSATKGRHVVASKRIYPGEIINAETPLQARMPKFTSEGYSEVCHHCLSEFELKGNFFYPSPIVQGVRFCSRDCLDASMLGYHNYEAEFLNEHIRNIKEGKLDPNKVLNDNGLLLMAARAFLHVRSKGLVDVDKQMEEDQDLENYDKDDFHYLEDIPFLFKLMAHEAEYDEEQWCEFAAKAVIFTAQLHAVGYFGKDMDRKSKRFEDEAKITIKFLMKFMMSFPHYVFETQRLVGAMDGDIPTQRSGAAIYKKGSMFNHSCGHNVDRVYNQKRCAQIIMYARQTIEVGEEVTLNYGPHHYQESFGDRHETLFKKYKFTCQCNACEMNYPTLAEILSDPEEWPSEVSKQVRKKAEKAAKTYKESFKREDYNNALIHAEKFTRLITEGGVEYPHRQYEFGAIALRSCWWIAVTNQISLRLPTNLVEVASKVVKHQNSTSQRQQEIAKQQEEDARSLVSGRGAGGRPGSDRTLAKRGLSSRPWYKEGSVLSLDLSQRPTRPTYIPKENVLYIPYKAFDEIVIIDDDDDEESKVEQDLAKFKISEVERSKKEDLNESVYFTAEEATPERPKRRPEEKKVQIYCRPEEKKVENMKDKLTRIEAELRQRVEAARKLNRK